MNETKKIDTKRLAESALMIAIGTVLSLIKLDMPFGGGVTLCSMLPLVMISHRYGWKWGTFTAFVYSLLQLLLGIDNVQYATSVGMAIAIILLDYVIAYTVIGIASVFDGTMKNGRASLAAGIVVTFMARLACHFVSGWLIWDALWPNELGLAAPVYSFYYNGTYMLAETLITCVLALLLYKPLGRYFTRRA